MMSLSAINIVKGMGESSDIYYRNTIIMSELTYLMAGIDSKQTTQQ